jgi:hypothetical protein
VETEDSEEDEEETEDSEEATLLTGAEEAGTELATEEAAELVFAVHPAKSRDNVRRLTERKFFVFISLMTFLLSLR